MSQIIEAPETLEVVPRDKLEELVEYVEANNTPSQVEAPSAPEASTVSLHPAKSDTLRATTVLPTFDELADVAFALALVPPDARDDWLRAGMTLHGTGWPQARPLWDAWSALCPEKFDVREQDHTWRSFHPHPNGVGVGSIFCMANEYRDGPRASEKDRIGCELLEAIAQPESQLGEPGDWPTEPSPFSVGGERPSIVYQAGSDAIPLHKLVPRAIARLAERCRETVFSRGGQLVRVTSEGRPGLRGLTRVSRLRIATLSDATLRATLDGVAKWSVASPGEGGKAKSKETWCPRPVVMAIRDCGEWPGIRPLIGIVEAPTLRPDGSVLDTVGYDEATGLLYQPSRTYPRISERPTESEITAALAVMLDPFREFQFEGEADRASLAALLLTIAARSAIDGPVPHWSVMAPTFGAGKTLLCEAAALAITGVHPDLMSPVGGRMSDAEAEMRKRLTTLILDAPRVAIIDNLPDGATFESKAFAALLTMTVWTDRLLGKNEKVHLPHMIVWLSTGCNYRLWGDLARRSLSIVIDPGVEDPDRRTFEIEDLLRYVRDRHPDLLAAALTILRGFVVAGMPGHSRSPLGKYEAWDRLIRAAVIWATGLAGAAVDPLDTAARLKEEAPDRTGKAELLAAWGVAFPDGEPVTARQATDRAKDDYRLWMAILGVGGGRKGVPDSRALGNRLRVAAGGVLDGATFRQAGKLQGSVLWRRVLVGAGESGGSCGSVASSAVLPRARTCAHVKSKEAPPRLTGLTSPTTTPAASPENEGTTSIEALEQLEEGGESSLSAGTRAVPGVGSEPDPYAAEERAAIQAESGEDVR